MDNKTCGMLDSHAFHIVAFVNPSWDLTNDEPPEALPHFQFALSMSLIRAGKMTRTSARHATLGDVSRQVMKEFWILRDCGSPRLVKAD